MPLVRYGLAIMLALSAAACGVGAPERASQIQNVNAISDDIAAVRMTQSPSRPSNPNSTVGSLLEYVLTVSPEQAKCRMSPADAESLALRWFARTPPLLWTIAQRHFAAGDFTGAAALLERLVEMGRTGDYDHGAAFDPEVMGGPALMNLGVCRLRTGEWDRARDCFAQLLTHPTYQSQASTNMELANRKKRAESVS